MALLEAQACGVPVVAGASGGVAEIVAHGRTGLLVPPQDVVAFAGATRTLLCDGAMRLRMNIAARAKVGREHDIGAAAARLRGLQARLRPLLIELADAGRATAAVTHKGVIRAVYGLAAGWDMRGKPPHRLSSAAAHLFHLDGTGVPAIERLNIAMSL